MIVVDGVLYGADEIVARYIQSLCGGGFEASSAACALGVLGTDGLVGGIAFSNYQPDRDITITVASREMGRCGHPRVIARCLAYPFIDLGLQRVSAEIDAGNTRSLRNARMLGFVEEGRKRGTGVLLLGLLRDEFVFREYLPSGVAPRSSVPDGPYGANGHADAARDRGQALAVG